MQAHIQKEIDYQEEQRDELINMNDYSLQKGEISDLQHYARADKICVDFRVIMERILSDNK